NPVTGQPVANEYACRYNEGYHCVPLPSGSQSPFCASNVPASCSNRSTNPSCLRPSRLDPTCADPANATECATAGSPCSGSGCCCVCNGCANVCGDGTVQSATGEQCDLGQAFLDAATRTPDNYAAGGTACTASCTRRFGWIGDPCRTTADCANLASPLCLKFDPLNPTDPKFRTRYEVYTGGNGGFDNN